MKLTMADKMAIRIMYRNRKSRDKVCEFLNITINDLFDFEIQEARNKYL